MWRRRIFSQTLQPDSHAERVAIQSLIPPLERHLLKPQPLVEWKPELEDEESNDSQFFIFTQFFTFPL